jgi:transglutaminase-like putative cysteine protease
MNRRLTVTAAVATVLASVALYPLITRLSWFWAGVGAVIVAAAIGAVTRLRTLPVIVCLLASLAGLILYLNALFAGPESFYRLIPTRASAHHLIWLAERANAETAKFAPPIPTTPGIVLLAAGGIGIVAIATDLLAVRLRRPALAGLPLLVLFCVPMTTIANPGWVSEVVVFSLGIAGYLALLSADGREQVRVWGRLVRPWPGREEPGGPDTRQLTAAGRRVGFAAVVLALCVPLILPSLREHRLFHGSGSGVGGHGYTGSLSLPNPLVQMNQQLRTPHPETILTYHTGDLAPPYLQVYVLGRLGTSDWSLAPPAASATVGGGTLPAVPGLTTHTPARTIRETITLGSALAASKNQVSYLPVPYAPRRVNLPGDWRAERNSLSVYTTTTSLAGLQYTVTSADVDPLPQQLRLAAAPPAAEHGYLAVPQPFQQLLALTRHVTAGQSSAYGKAVALQEWFTEPGNFTYSLATSLPPGPSGLINFVTKTRRGFCEQFAFAMAVMARLAGIPSRVVVGYTQGVDAGNGVWQVRTSDAHAWPELYFKGAGWLRFEPTPSGTDGVAGQATASAPAYSFPPAGSIVPTPQPTPSASTPGAIRPSAGPSRGGLGPGLKKPGAGGGPGAGAPAPLPIELLVIVVLLAAAVTPRAARSLIRQRRWFRAADDAGRANAAWLELRDDLADHRITCRASESPRALARRLGVSLGFGAAEREALERIARAEERARYAPTPLASAQLRGDVTTVRRAMAKGRSLPVRLAAIVLPASVLAPARAALTHALDVFGWMDVVTSGLHRRGEQAARSWGGSR